MLGIELKTVSPLKPWAARALPRLRRFEEICRFTVRTVPGWEATAWTLIRARNFVESNSSRCWKSAHLSSFQCLMADAKLHCSFLAVLHCQRARAGFFYNK
ncbi:MAG: hypothetical protein [Circular genetic element sp.]|nr:MAG: hypothetical protein [Circular genetic element sp.]